MEDEVIKSLADVAKEVAVPFYQDAVSPAAKEFGKGLTSVARMVNAGVYLAEDCVTTLTYVLRLAGQQLSVLPPEQVCLDKPRVSASIIEEARFSIGEPEIQSLFANLLAASMNKDKIQYAHPAYVEIIKQMESDEAKILKYMIENGGQAPTIRMIMESPPDKEGSEWVSISQEYKDVNLICENSGCEYMDNEIAYFANLKRLGLITSSNGTSFGTTDLHEIIYASDKAKALGEVNPQLSNRRYDKTMYILTVFGRGFMESCF